MSLDEQIQVLIQEAPQDGTTPQLVSAIVPVLRLFAEQLRHPEYYVLQTLEQNWVLTVVQNQAQPDIQKTILYAFSSLQDVMIANPGASRDPGLMALPVPVIQILFQLNGMEEVDSVVFLELPGDLNQGIEIQRQQLQVAVQQQLEQAVQPNISVIPPNIA
jgi:hypothetical protein